MLTFIQNIDGQLLLLIQKYVRSECLTPVMKGITHLGDAGIFWILLTIVLFLFPKSRKAGIVSAAALLLSLLITNLILKNLVMRIRPYEVVDGLKLLVAPQWDTSFPSGHTSASFASAAALWKKAPGKWSLLALILAFLIAFSRLYVGVHYPTDVLAGLLVGIGCGYGANRLCTRFAR